MEKIKWQIHAETSITQVMLWIIIWKLFGGWVVYLSTFMILSEFFTFCKASYRLVKLDKNYFK